MNSRDQTLTLTHRFSFEQIVLVFEKLTGKWTIRRIGFVLK